MNKILVVALISAFLTTGTMMVQAEANVTEPATITNVTASWHNPTGVLATFDITFESMVSRQGINFQIDGKDAGDSYVYGVNYWFTYTTGTVFDTRLSHTVCVNGACTVLDAI